MHFCGRWSILIQNLSKEKINMGCQMTDKILLIMESWFE